MNSSPRTVTITVLLLLPTLPAAAFMIDAPIPTAMASTATAAVLLLWNGPMMLSKSGVGFEAVSLPTSRAEAHCQETLTGVLPRRSSVAQMSISPRTSRTTRSSSTLPFVVTSLTPSGLQRDVQLRLVSLPALPLWVPILERSAMLTGTSTLLRSTRRKLRRTLPPPQVRIPRLSLLHHPVP